LNTLKTNITEKSWRKLDLLWTPWNWTVLFPNCL